VTQKIGFARSQELLSNQGETKNVDLAGRPRFEGNGEFSGAILWEEW